MSRLILPALALAALAVSASPADAQLFRRAAPCPTCPNGVCQPQPSGPMFVPVPASPAKPMPAAATCPGTAGNCTCNPPMTASSVRVSVSACSAAPSAGAFASGWRPGARLVAFVAAHRPHLIFR